MKTLFVVGAGASADFGLPVGSALQRQIVKFLRPDKHSENFGRDLEFVMNEIQARGLRYENLFATLEWMSDNLPMARSIDSFLETQGNDGDAISFLGKYAIATLISRGEAASPLFLPRKDSKPNFDAIVETWLGQLWLLINKGGAAKVDEKGLDDYAFLTFNYDRCIELFLYRTFSSFFRMSHHTAQEFVERVSIRHVYGSLGDALGDSRGLPFGYTELAEERVESVGNIKTYSEQLADEEVQKIGAMFDWAEAIVFVGFSFAPMNTKLLQASFRGDESLRKIYGTSYQMSQFDKRSAESWCGRVFRNGFDAPHLEDQTGAEFFRQHQLLFQ